VKIFVAILIAVVPVCAQAQSPSVPKVTKADAQKVVKIISGNKAKTQTYCDMAKLFNQIQREKNIKKTAELNRKLDELAKRLGPESAALVISRELACVEHRYRNFDLLSVRRDRAAKSAAWQFSSSPSARHSHSMCWC
jgi:hypothetical protein